MSDKSAPARSLWDSKRYVPHLIYARSAAAGAVGREMCVAAVRNNARILDPRCPDCRLKSTLLAQEAVCMRWTYIVVSLAAWNALRERLELDEGVTTRM